MPKALHFAWVKNVYSLRTTHGTNSALVPTVINPAQKMTQINREQPTLIRPSVPQLTQHISTPKTTIYDLLNALYTHNPQYLLIERIKKI